MTKTKQLKDDVIPFNFAQAILNPKSKVEKKHHPGFYDYLSETVDIDEGWVYELLPDFKKGKRLRKFFESFRPGPEGMGFWKPRLNDLKKCESQRWKAVQYGERQLDKINGVFQKILDNRPFCCVRIEKDSPNYNWVIFEKLKGSRGVSWEYWSHTSEAKKSKAERPNCQLRQDIGDEWFNYEKRSQLIRQRVYYFNRLFWMAIEKRYSEMFYHDEVYKWGQRKKKLIINGRDYIIGMNNSKFEILVSPEDVDMELVK